MMLGGKPLLAILLAMNYSAVAARSPNRNSRQRPRSEADNSHESMLKQVEDERVSYEPIPAALFTPGDTTDARIRARAAATSDTTLHDHDDLYYAPQGFEPGRGMPFARFQIGGNGATTKVLTTERFKNVVKGAVCIKDPLKEVLIGNSKIAMVFRDRVQFQAARKEWSWINEQDDHTVILITESRGCNAADGDETDRQPWHVKRVAFEAGELRVVFDAESQNWDKAFGDNWRLTVTREREEQAGNVSRRDNRHFHTKRGSAFSIDLNKDFSGLGFPFPASFLDVVKNGKPGGYIACDPCFTFGELDFDVDIQPDVKGLKGKVSIVASGVGASITTKLAIFQKLLNRMSGDIPIWGYVPKRCGVYIKGLVDIGPTIKLLLSTGFATATPDEAVQFSMGYNLTLPDPSEFSLELSTSGFDPKIKGWEPQFKALTPGISKDLSLRGEIGPKLGLSLDFDILGWGASVGFTFSAATLSFKIETVKEKPVCNNPKYEKGVGIDLNLVQNINAYESINVLIFKTSATQTLASTSYDLLTTCMPMDGRVTEIPTAMPTASYNSYIPHTGDLKDLALSQLKMVQSKVKEAYSEAEGAIVKTFVPAVTEAFETVTAKATEIVDAIETKAPEVIETATQALETGVNEVKGGFEKAAEAIAGIF